MKTIFLSIALISGCILTSLGQGNPSISSVGFGSSPIAKNTSSTLTIVVANGTWSSGDIPAGNFRVQISLPANEVYTLSDLASPLGNGNTTLPGNLQISDDFGNAFNWVGDGTGYYQGTSNKVIPQLKQIKLVLQIFGNAVSVATTTTINVQGLNGTSATNLAGDDNRHADIAVDSPLPVTLISFEAQKENKQANLTWTTSGEINSDYFEIQNSLDGKTWSALNKVESNKDSKATNFYNYTHISPSSGTNYYRLKIVDRDATFAYSRIRNVEIDGEVNSLYPNPASTYLQVPATISNIQVFTTSGQLVLSPEISNGQIDIQNLKPGLYILKSASNTNIQTTNKFVVGK